MSSIKQKNQQRINKKITSQKMKFFIKDFFSKCDQIRWKLRIWSHLLKKSLMNNFIFCAVNIRDVATYKSIINYMPTIPGPTTRQ